MVEIHQRNLTKSNNYIIENKSHFPSKVNLCVYQHMYFNFYIYNVPNIHYWFNLFTVLLFSYNIIDNF